jgi:hypothetical protein
MWEVKTIANYPNYTISNTGVVFNLRTQKIMKLHPDKDGYWVLNLSSNGHKRSMRVHRLVAEAFIWTNDTTLTVNHINGIKEDNTVENLEWLSNIDNIKHAFRTGLTPINPKGERSRRSKLTNTDANQIREWISNNTHTRKEIADMFNICLSSVSNIINYKTYKD